MKRVAVLENDDMDRSLLEAHIQRYFRDEGTPVRVDSFDGAQSLVHAFVLGTYDLLVFDCLLSEHGPSGIDVLRDLRRRGEDAPAVIVSSSPDFAVEGYGVGVVAYLLKPLSYGHVKTELDRLGVSVAPRARRTVSLPGSVPFDPAGYVLVHSSGHYVVFKGTDGASEKRLWASFSEAREALGPWSQFFQCTRGVLVNLDFVSDLDGSDFVLYDGRRVPISRRLLPTARTAMAEWGFSRMREEGRR